MSFSIKNWIKKPEGPFIVAGPCSAETEEQVLATAKLISKDSRVKVFRSGVWKPRTRPGNFEGAGEIALEWLKKVKEQTGLLTTIEVANPNHVEAALKHGIDMVWLGARTTVNPFMVQELAEALKGTDIPVMVKNPVNPDLQLWMGAVERLQKVGLEDVIAVHRGFSSLSQNKYRNYPNWALVIEFKSLMPNVPVICDPSHIAGKREMILEVSQRAIDLDTDGLMIETHIDPENARTDARQQVSPAQLTEILDQLVFRSAKSSDFEFLNRLEQLRKRIDKIDLDIVDLLSARMQIVEEIGLYKKENDITVLQIERWKEILKNMIAQAENSEVNIEFVKQVYQLIHEESIRLQTNVMNQKLAKNDE